MKTFITFLLLVCALQAQPGGPPPLSGNAGLKVYNPNAYSVLILVSHPDVPEAFNWASTPSLDGFQTAQVEFNPTLHPTWPLTGYQIFIRSSVDDGTLVGNSYVSTGALPEPDGEWIQFGETFTLVVDAWTEHVVPIWDRRSATPDESKTLWRVTGDTLNAQVFREGIDKLVASTPTSGGSGMTKTEFQATATDDIAQAQIDLAGENKNEAYFSALAASKKTLAEASVAQAVPTLGTKGEINSPTSYLAPTLPYIGTINLDPASDPEMYKYCTFVKLVTGWALLVAFAWWSWSEFKTIVSGVTTVTQAKGNPVVGGTGAQATALLAAGLIFAVFLGVPAAYWLLVTVDTSSLSSNPFNSAPNTVVQTGLYLLALVFPYALALTLLAAAFVIRKAGTVMVLGVNAAVKFIVP